jgi:hypothetical protein
MGKRKRRRAVCCVVRSVRLVAGGKSRSAKKKLTWLAALREIPGDPIERETRLLSRIPLKVTRRLAPGVRVEMVYWWDGKMDGDGHTVQTVDLNTQAARQVARGGGVL